MKMLEIMNVPEFGLLMKLEDNFNLCFVQKIK